MFDAENPQSIESNEALDQARSVIAAWKAELIAQQQAGKVDPNTSQIIADLIQFVESLLLGVPYTISYTIPKEQKTFTLNLFGRIYTITVGESNGVLSISETPG